MRSLATHALSYWKLLPRGWEGGGTLRCLRCMQRGFRAEAGMRVRQTEMLRPLRALHAGQRACQDLSRDFGKRDFQSAPAAAGNDFDWRQSVVLAGASFEAYFELAHKTNAVHINTNDACITYVDETFLRQCMDGLLHVELLRATGLPSEELWDVSNRVYCTVELGGSKVETRALEKPAYGGKGVRALLPGPKEEKPSPPPAPKLLFIQDRAKARRLRVKLWRSRLGRPLEALGSGELDLQQGLGGRGGWREVAIALKPDAKEAAGDESSAAAPPSSEAEEGKAEAEQPRVVTLSLQYVAMEDALEQDLAQPRSSLLGAPGEEFESNPWRELQEAAAIQLGETFTPLCFITHPRTDTQAWLYWNLGKRQLCIAFRGTEQDNWRDYLTDISLAPALLDPAAVPTLPLHRGLADSTKQATIYDGVMSRLQRVRAELDAITDSGAGDGTQGGEEGDGGAKAADPGASSVVTAALEAVKGSAGEARVLLDRLWQAVSEAEAVAEEAGAEDRPWVHQGFLAAYDSVRGATLGLMRAALARGGGGGGGEPWHVFVTGHSLGGALGTLCSYDLALHDWGGGPAPHLTMYNFGSPRVGNRRFAREYNDLVPNSWRIVNNQDAVCSVPRLMGYCHVGHAVRLLGDGRVEVQRDTSLALGEGTAMPDIMPAVAGMITAVVPQFTSKATAMVMAAIPALAKRAADGASAAVAATTDPDDVSATRDELEAAQKLWGEEVAAWSAMLDRASFSQHLEELYLESLSSCVRRTWAPVDGGDSAADVEEKAPEQADP
ncbi:hypothetical protein ACKKBG_A08865 [Auxenochlorella protothecoides x Auxenochlorella symbiontica]